MDKSVKKDDIMFLFVRHVESAFSGDVVQPAEIALVGMCREVDSHYAYVIKSNTILREGDDVHDIDIEENENYEELGSVDHTDEYD